jgi:hypothetical protein
MMPATLATLAASLQSSAVAPLPAETPIGGPLWSYVVPALLLAVAAFGTLMLYRHFAKRGE